MRPLACAALLLIAAPALGRDGPTPKILGWTADGANLVWITAPEEAGEPNDFGYDGSVTRAVVLDARTGLTAREFVMKVTGTPTAAEKKRFAALGKRADFEAWQRAHPTACAGGRASADGKAQADIQISGKGIAGRWKGDRFQFGWDERDEEAEIGARASLSLSVKRDGKTTASADWAGDGGAGSLSGEVTPCWSPDARRVAWIVHRRSGMMRDPGDTSILVGPAGGPRIQLVADKSVLAEAATRVGAALDRAGFATVACKASNEKTPRAATVIYAAPTHEAIAKVMAAAVPGGATVAKIDWRASYDLIVGIGATALK